MRSTDSRTGVTSTKVPTTPDGPLPVPLYSGCALTLIHLTGESAFRVAIDRVQWSYPEDRAVLGYIHVLGDLGQGRFEIAAERRSYVLEVPPGVSHRELVQPGKYLWAIMSTPRFDKAIKKLVLRAEDFEEHYVQGRD